MTSHNDKNYNKINVTNQPSEAHELVNLSYKVISSDLIGLIAREFRINYTLRKLTEKINNALKPRNISYTFQRIDQLIKEKEGENK